MRIKALIFKEIERVPEQHLPEVLDFIRSLEEGKIFKEKIGTAITRETSLKKDWLRPEEDQSMKLNDSKDALRLLQDYLGHASFNTTAKYRRISDEKHRKWYELLLKIRPASL